MKQNISKKQWDELNPREQAILNEWFDDKVGHTEDSMFDYPDAILFNIGQMIEYLGKEYFDNFIKSIIDSGREIVGLRLDTFCDALWEAVKVKSQEQV